MEKILYLESIAGIAGDMFAASFVNAGLVPFEELAALPSKLGLTGVRVVQSQVRKATMAATHLDVQWVNESWKSLFREKKNPFVTAPAHLHSGHWHAPYVQIDSFLEKSELESPVKKMARKIFRLIAEAEAHAHGGSVESVAFHEIGTIDSILDVVMAAHCVILADASRILASPVKLGRGTIKIAHGTHAIPPPAAAWLVQKLETAAVPEMIARESVELSTPTGLAILRALDVQFSSGWPSGKVLASGMGAGTMDLGDYPNVFRVVLLETMANTSLSGKYESDEVVEISTNIDDQTAERTAWAAEQLLELGALDAWQTPVLGKKNRMATVLTLLCEPSRADFFKDWLLTNTSSFGVRHRPWNRTKLARRFEEREVAGKQVRVKIGTDRDGRVLKEKIEFEDWKKLPKT